MSDIVERLRKGGPCIEAAGCDGGGPCKVMNASSGCACAEAADEITRLRNELHIAEAWSARVIAGTQQDVIEIARLTAENERLRAALRAVMDDLTLIGENHWLPIGLLNDVIYVNARAALDEK